MTHQSTAGQPSAVAAGERPRPDSARPGAQPPPKDTLAELARAGNPTLRHMARLFARYPSPRVLAALLAVLVPLRVIAGPFSIWDVVVVAGFLAWQPIQEWLIHVYILHWRPRRILGRTLDPKLAQRHRAHHEEPQDLPRIFMPIDAMLFSLVLHAAILFAVMPSAGLALTALVAVVAIGAVYEWTHFLIHTSYRPRSAFYRRIWRYHRLHHFKNEHYWFGVTMHQGDRLLGTLPDPTAVPTTHTARTLGPLD